MAHNSSTDVSFGPIEDLATRIQRIQFYVDEGNEQPESSPSPGSQSAIARLQAIQRTLRDICAKHPIAQAILDLYQSCPELFPQHGPSFFNTTEQLAMLKAYANAIPNFQSQLSLTQDLPVPPTESFTSLASLQPRLNKLEGEHRILADNIAQLRYRSAALLQRWYEVAVLAGGDCWVEWESRLEAIEREIRKQELLTQAELDT